MRVIIKTLNNVSFTSHERKEKTRGTDEYEFNTRPCEINGHEVMNKYEFNRLVEMNECEFM